MQRLDEVTRNQLINKSKSSQKGKERFNKRNNSRIENVVRAMNNINMDKLFKEGILSVGIPVHGETDDYTVTLAFGGFLDLLHRELQKSNQLTFREISRAVINGFNQDDVYISCTCPDAQFRFQYWSTKNKYNSTNPETRPSKITNPNDTLGSICKHGLLVLNNNSWIMKVSRCIMNYINYMQQHYQKMYADIIYPAIYGKEYEEPVQLSLIDTDDLQTDTEIINKSNQAAIDRTRFKPGNQSGIQFAPKNRANNQLSFDDVNPDDEL